MNRRSFLRNSALALFGFTVLPPAETYQRVWRAEYRCIMEMPNPTTTMYSELVTVMVENPERMLVIENFSIPEVMDKIYEIRKNHPLPEILYARSY